MKTNRPLTHKAAAVVAEKMHRGDTTAYANGDRVTVHIACGMSLTVKVIAAAERGDG